LGSDTPAPGSPSLDYYAVLGVPRDADEGTIKQAFRSLAGAHHPDRQPDDDGATARFQAVLEAYRVLSDPAARRRYDAEAVTGPVVVEPGTPLQELLGGVVDQVLGVRRPRPSEGRDHEYRLELSFSDMARGGSQTLSVPGRAPCLCCDGRGFPLEVPPVSCARCGGSGEVQRRVGLRLVAGSCELCGGRGHELSVACEECGGAGRVATRRRVEIDITPGVAPGTRLRVRGAGEPGQAGAAAGDLLVRVAVRPHCALQREGRDVVVERPVPVFVALTGGWVGVPTVEGARRLKLPAGVRDGAVLRMPGLGIGPAGGDRGDQLVTVRVELPRALDEAQAQRLRTIAEELGLEAFPESEAFEVTHLP
jgi:molecular chaperone DnaJ